MNKKKSKRKPEREKMVMVSVFTHLNKLESWSARCWKWCCRRQISIVKALRTLIRPVGTRDHSHADDKDNPASSPHSSDLGSQCTERTTSTVPVQYRSTSMAIVLEHQYVPVHAVQVLGYKSIVATLQAQYLYSTYEYICTYRLTRFTSSL